MTSDPAVVPFVFMDKLPSACREVKSVMGYWLRLRVPVGAAI
jgi:hypothetical protein